MTRKASDKSTARLKTKDGDKTTVRFISSHTHAGTQYEKGDELEADPGLVARLKRFGVIDARASLKLHASPSAMHDKTQGKGEE